MKIDKEYTNSFVINSRQIVVVFSLSNQPKVLKQTFPLDYDTERLLKKINAKGKIFPLIWREPVGVEREVIIAWGDLIFEHRLEVTR